MDHQPDIQDARYGAHPLQRFDLWRCGVQRAALVVYIHGGGWIGGDKSSHAAELASLFSSRGMSFASINYRLCPDHPLPAPVDDAALALQHLRYHSSKYDIDPERIGLHGWSAGACSALCLAFGPDRKDPLHHDPLYRQSSRPNCVAAKNGQGSIDPGQVVKWVGKTILDHRMIPHAVGEKSRNELEVNLSLHRDILQKHSPHALIGSHQIPPVFLEYGDYTGTLTPNESIHHQNHGHRLKSRLMDYGHEVQMTLRNNIDPRPTLSLDFFTKKLTDSLIEA